MLSAPIYCIDYRTRDCPCMHARHCPCTLVRDCDVCQLCIDQISIYVVKQLSRVLVFFK